MTEEYISKKDLEDFAMDCVGGVVNIKQIHNFPAADVVPVVRCADCKWIPVEARMPEAEYGESEDVLTIDSLKVMRVAYFDGGNWCYPTGEVISTTCKFHITHWMPLPEPPKEETDGD